MNLEDRTYCDLIFGADTVVGGSEVAISWKIWNRYIGKGGQGRNDVFLWLELAEYHAAKPESWDEYLFVSGNVMSFYLYRFNHLILNAYGQ